MQRSRFPQRFAAWLAMFAILLAALAPTVSHATAAARGGASWMEICTSAGPAMIRVADDQAPGVPAGNDQGIHLEHCAFCLTHAGAFALPAAALAALPVITGSDSPPLLFHRAPRPLFVWAAGQPRAPPSAS